METYFWAHLSTNITLLYNGYPQFFNGFDILMTCRDSYSDTWNDLSADPRAKDLRFVRIDDVLLVPAKHVGKFVCSDLMTFFSELYLFPEGYDITHWSNKKVFTPDYLSFQQSFPEELICILRSTGARRYVSDGAGFGLNIISDQSEDIKHLKAIFDTQR